MCGERGVAQVARSQRGADDVVDVDVPDQAAAVAMPDQIAGLVLTASPGQESSEALRRVRRRYPRLLHRSTGTGCRDELVSVSGRGLREDYLHQSSEPVSG